LREGGVKVIGALPAHLLRAAFARIDLRNHRKIAVIDGVIGYTGSQNIADASFAPKPRFAPWVDCMLRIEGPVVWDLQTIFVCDWFLDSGEPLEDLLTKDTGDVDDGVTLQILPTGPAYDNEALEQLSLSAFHHAREELILTTPYFVPGESEVSSLCTAAKRGVRVALVLPARNDSLLVGAVSRSHYGQLVAAGVHVYEYQKGLLHSKTLTVDRNLAMVTTANFDQRSFDLNFEVTALVYDTDFASQLRFMQRSYIEDSVLVTADRIAGRSWLRRLLENAAGVFSPLL
jgi:cardiolipin synthase